VTRITDACAQIPALANRRENLVREGQFFWPVEACNQRQRFEFQRAGCVYCANNSVTGLTREGDGGHGGATTVGTDWLLG
jgi:hypothetical protein